MPLNIRPPRAPDATRTPSTTPAAASAASPATTHEERARNEGQTATYEGGATTTMLDVLPRLGPTVPAAEGFLDAVARLEPKIAAQVTALEAQLHEQRIVPADFALALTVETGDPAGGRVAHGRAGTSERDRLVDHQGDALVVALEVARRVGHRVAVVAHDGSGGFVLAEPSVLERSAQAARVIERFLALKYGEKLPVSVDTRRWLENTRAPGSRVGASTSKAGDALGLARALLDRTPSEHGAALHLQETVPAASLAPVEELWRRDGLVGAGVAVGPQAARVAPKLFDKATVAADADALVDLVGLGRATALMRSVVTRAQEDLTALVDYRQMLAEARKEDTRLVADAWLAARVETTVTTEASVERKLVKEVYRDPLVFDLAGEGKLTTRKVDAGLTISTEVSSEKRSSTTTETAREGRPLKLYDRTYETTRTEVVTTRRETRFAEWLGKDVGVLVFDRGSDGIQAADLFGDSSVSGRDAKNGFEDLRALDENNDGVIDKKDPVFQKLRIWRDLDGDGKPNPNELFTLEQAGISTIRLGHKETDDATFPQQGTFRSTRADELDAKIAALPEHARRTADVQVAFDGRGAAAGSRVVGGAVLTDAALDAEIARRKARVEALRKDLAALEQRATGGGPSTKNGRE